MSVIVYSEIYSRKADVDQLLALYVSHSIKNPNKTLNDIPDHSLEIVSLDIQLHSCGVEGTILVNCAKPKGTAKVLRQEQVWTH
jgi:hypothetical protein